ncbi:MAG: formyltransferase family protein, partial [Myxococcota bacterium]
MSASQTPKPSCVLAGSESLLIQCGALLLEREWGIAYVVSKDEAIVDWAEAQGLAVCAPGKSLAASLSGVAFDWFLSITNLSILSEDVLALPQKGAINFHDGPLPAYAGMYTPAWALLHGASEYGITFHEMTAGIDDGRILVQKRFPIADGETSLSLNTSCYAAAIEGFAELATQLETDALAPVEQDASGRSYFARHQRPEAAGVLDFDRPAAENARIVRALDFGDRYENPFCAAKVVHDGRVARVSSARVEADAEAEAGVVRLIDDAGWHVGAGEDTLVLSGFGCPRGRAWSPAEAAEALGVAVGTRLASGIDRAKLTASNEAMTPAERFWARRLEKLDPVEAPYRSSGQGDEAGRSASEPLVLEPLAGAESGDDVAARFLLYLARIQGVHAFDVTWVDEAL